MCELAVVHKAVRYANSQWMLTIAQPVQWALDCLLLGG
jgi:hypothetical protein